MDKVSQFILTCLEEPGEDTITCLINTAVSHQIVGHDAAPEKVLDAVSCLLSTGQVSLAEMRYGSDGRGRLTMLRGAEERTLAAWAKHIIWNPDENIWKWDRIPEFWPYVVLGRESRWRTAEPGDPEPDDGHLP
jgi:hypothetical protein